MQMHYVMKKRLQEEYMCFTTNGDWKKYKYKYYILCNHKQIWKMLQQNQSVVVTKGLSITNLK